MKRVFLSEFPQFLAKAVSLVILALSLSSCGLDGKILTSKGSASEPEIAWNGTDFGIAYLYSSSAGSSPEIRLLKVDSDGKTIKGPSTVVASTSHLEASNLVWNGDNKQFALAYSTGKVIKFVRFDSNLLEIGPRVEIRWKIPDNEHPDLADLSLVWNGESKEYALTYITLDRTASKEIHDHVWVSQISAQGKFLGPYQRRIIVKCPSDCRRTSVAYDAKSGKYVVAYFKNNRPKLGFFGPSGYAQEFALSTSSQIPNAIKIFHDKRSGDYMVVDVGYAGELGYRIVRPNGTSLVGYSSQGKGYDSIFTISNMPALGDHRFVLCATQYDQILCRVITETGVFAPDWVSPTKGVYSKHPSMAVPGILPYIAWIQDNSLRFGHPSEKP